ncbi:hypothetical protein CFP56_031884 [Quercus suber]|uniref:Uncharacterized protein n=1 Tax=Quercus suber TaxID=58331 RepID=A0AAW0LTG9_QUESU
MAWHHVETFTSKEIKNVVVGKSKNDNSIENQQIEVAYTFAKCFINVTRLLNRMHRIGKRIE